MKTIGSQNEFMKNVQAKRNWCGKSEEILLVHNYFNMAKVENHTFLHKQKILQNRCVIL